MALRATITMCALYLTALHILYAPGPMLSALTFLFFGALVAAEITAGSLREWRFTLSWDSWQGSSLVGVVSVLGVLVALCAIQDMRAILSDTLVNQAVADYGVRKDALAASRTVGQAITILPQNDRAQRAAVELGIAELAQLAAQNPSSDIAHAQLQKILSQTIGHGLAAVQAESGNYQNWLELAHLYDQLAGVGVKGAGEEARGAYEKARVANPTNPLPLLGLAQLDLAAKDARAAQQHLTQALALKSDIPQAHFLLVQADAQLGDLAGAQDHAIATVQLVPQDPLGWYTLGAVLYSRGSYSDSIAALQRAISLQTSYANAYFMIGLAYFELGQKDNAIAAMQKVLELDPSNQLPSAVIQNIERGRAPLAAPPAKAPKH